MKENGSGWEVIESLCIPNSDVNLRFTVGYNSASFLVVCFTTLSVSKV
jgi:hypothetical protein